MEIRLIRKKFNVIVDFEAFSRALEQSLLWIRQLNEGVDALKEAFL
jgi:hypothetical protein